MKCGFRHKSKRVERKYDELDSIAKERQKILCQIDEIQFKLDNYDEIYSDAIEYSTTKEELSDELKRLQYKEKVLRTKI